VRPSYRGVPARPPAGFPVERGQDLAPEYHPVWDAVAATFEQPFVGITTEGAAAPGLFAASGGSADEGLVAAGRAYFESLTPEQREGGWVQPADSPVWRQWTNAFPRWKPAGVLLEDLSQEQRQAALNLMESSLSPEGFATVRNIMRLDQTLGELIGYMQDTLSEWVYWFTLFGEPSPDQPWGWQIMGHHLDLHCFVLGEQTVLTPMFLGAEFCVVDEGPNQGIRVFDRERDDALALVNALTPEQRREAILYDSILTRDLPPELDHPSNGRMRAGAGSDNAVIPYEGVGVASFDDRQAELLMTLLRTHTAALPEPQRSARLAELREHLDETYFAWIGGTGPDDAFFYKLHSPVFLVEYDCHKGVFLEADEPLPFHTHVVVRTPNGNDYGKALLAGHAAKIAGKTGSTAP
jgi:hypothetical protein